MGSFGTPFFLSLPILLRWPDELSDLHNQLSGTDKIAALWRCDQFHDAELRILPRLAERQNDLKCLILLALCAESLKRSVQHRFLIEHLSREFSDHEMTRWLKLRHWLNNLDSKSIELAGTQIWRGEQESPFLTVLRCRFLLASKSFDQLQRKFKSLDPLEIESRKVEHIQANQLHHSFHSRKTDSLYRLLQDLMIAIPFLVRRNVGLSQVAADVV